MRQKADMTRWQGRTDDAEGELGLRWHQIIRPLEQCMAGQDKIALLGFACDSGVARNQGRTGTREGPTALRSILSNIPVRQCRHIVDAGDVICVLKGDDDGMEEAQDELSLAVAELLEKDLLPIVMGGGHEMAYGTFNGLARFLATHATSAPPRIGIINLDAHFDLRMAQNGNSGTPFRQIAEACQRRSWPFHYCCLGISEFSNTQALFERARTLNVLWRLDEEMDISHLPATLKTLQDFMQQVDHIYLTICLDVLPSAIAPGVSAPAARGVALEVIEPIVDLIARSNKIRVADVAELNPSRDIDQRTARVGARLIARIAERSGTR